jgi:hypothetical protein
MKTMTTDYRLQTTDMESGRPAHLTHYSLLITFFFLASSITYAQEAGSRREPVVPRAPIVKDAPTQSAGPVLVNPAEKTSKTIRISEPSDKTVVTIPTGAVTESEGGVKDPRRALYPEFIPKVGGGKEDGSSIHPDENLKGTVTRARTDLDAPKDKYAGKDRKDLIKLIEQSHNRIQTVIEQMQKGRKKYGQEKPLKSATIEELEARIREAKEEIQKVHPAVHELYAEDTPRSHLNKADLFFSIGRYREALNEYYIIRERHFDDLASDASRAWTDFQIGECQMLLRRSKQAIDRWEQLNKYFRDRGEQSVDQLDSKFLSFDKDPSGAATWATGFWRRYARNVTDNAKILEELIQDKNQITERRRILAIQTAGLIPPEELRLRAQR